MNTYSSIWEQNNFSLENYESIKKKRKKTEKLQIC